MPQRKTKMSISDKVYLTRVLRVLKSMKENPNQHATMLCAKHKVNNHVWNAIVKYGGIVKNTGHKRSPDWIVYNLSLVDEKFIRMVRDASNKYYSEKRRKKINAAKDLEQRVQQLEDKLDKLTDASKDHFLIYKQQVIDSVPGNPYIPGHIRKSFNETYELFDSISQATKPQNDNDSSK